MDRNEVVTKLVEGSLLSAEERRFLGPFVTRAEVGAVIALLLHEHGRFPLNGEGGGGLQIVVAPVGVRVISGRRSASKTGQLTTLEAAISHYIDRELGPSCHGMPIRSAPP
jgi:hypothetical protein